MAKFGLRRNQFRMRPGCVSDASRMRPGYVGILNSGKLPKKILYLTCTYSCERALLLFQFPVLLQIPQVWMQSSLLAEMPCMPSTYQTRRSSLQRRPRRTSWSRTSGCRGERPFKAERSCVRAS